MLDQTQTLQCARALKQKRPYYDTDSSIFVSRPGEYDPPLGDYIGELTNDLKAEVHIVEFVSGGPKNMHTNNGKETCKVRGFSLHFTNSNLINFGSVKEIVTNTADCKTIEVTNPSIIRRDQRKRKLFNREESKHIKWFTQNVKDSTILMCPMVIRNVYIHI